MAKRPRPSTRVTSLKGLGVPLGSRVNRHRSSLDQSSYENQYPPECRGSRLAQEFFNVYDYGDDCISENADESGYDAHEGKEPVETYWWPQLGLALETEEELRNRLRNDINRFERAYSVMALYAVRWKQLMEDVEDNPQVEKMFKDMQLMRKLSGSDME